MDNNEFMDAMRNYIKPQIDLTITANQKCVWCKTTKDIKVNYKYGFDWIVSVTVCHFIKKMRLLQVLIMI